MAKIFIKLILVCAVLSNGLKLDSNLGGIPKQSFLEIENSNENFFFQSSLSQDVAGMVEGTATNVNAQEDIIDGAVAGAAGTASQMIEGLKPTKDATEAELQKGMGSQTSRIQGALSGMADGGAAMGDKVSTEMTATVEESMSGLDDMFAQIEAKIAEFQGKIAAAMEANKQKLMDEIKKIFGSFGGMQGFTEETNEMIQAKVSDMMGGMMSMSSLDEMTETAEEGTPEEEPAEEEPAAEEPAAEEPAAEEPVEEGGEGEAEETEMV